MILRTIDDNNLTRWFSFAKKKKKHTHTHKLTLTLVYTLKNCLLKSHEIFGLH